MERLQKIGKVKPVGAKEVKDSRLGLGMEKLDRDAFDPEKVYDRVAALGVKWIRLQSGWQKTERAEGVYDFSWLDRQVDELRARGLIPWLCLCYGNALYDPLASQYVGAVGCAPIRTERQRTAWLNYVGATVRHFAGRIEYYEIWNEPEGDWTWRPTSNAREYAEFCLATAEAIRTADAQAKVITGSHYEESLQHFSEEFGYGTLGISDAVTYHSYHYDETHSMDRAHALRELIRLRGGHAEVIQGESGSQSRSGGGGALGWIRSDQEMQTKQILRHAVGDILSGVKFTSLFSCVDMAENLDAKEGEPITSCGYFGLLGADFDKKTGKLIGDYHEKPSYYAYQNLCALFCDGAEAEDLPVLFTPQFDGRLNTQNCPTRELLFGGVRRGDAHAFCYWRATDLVTVKGYEGSVSFEISGVDGAVSLIDPVDGSVYSLPDEILTVSDCGLYRFQNLPVKDYPLILTFGDFPNR